MTKVQMNDELQRFVDGYRFRLQENTLEAYETNIKEFFAFTGSDYTVIRPADIRGWMVHLQEIGRKPATIHQKMASLRLFFRYLMEEQLLTRNPAEKIMMPRQETKVPCYLKKEELEKLRDLVIGSQRERAIVETLYATGVRIGELVDMQWADVSWEDRTIHIRKGKGKKERIVLFSLRCREYLVDYLHTRNDHLPNMFLNSKGKPVQCKALRLTFAGYSDRLGFKVTPHTLRHTFAAHLAEKDMPLPYIQDLLGHDSIEATKIYAKLYEEARKRTYDQYL